MSFLYSQIIFFRKFITIKRALKSGWRIGLDTFVVCNIHLFGIICDKILWVFIGRLTAAFVGASICTLTLWMKHLNFILLFCFFVETFSTKRHVHFCATNHFVGETWTFPESKVCVTGANEANRWQFFYFFTKRNNFKNIAPAFFFESAIESWHDDDFAIICSFFRKLNNIIKKLTFVDSYHIKLNP